VRVLAAAAKAPPAKKGWFASEPKKDDKKVAPAKKAAPAPVKKAAPAPAKKAAPKAAPKKK